MKTNKTNKSLYLTINLRAIAAVIIALILGFVGGVYYSDHYNNTSLQSTAQSGTPPVCMCPMIRVGETPIDCRC
jgi:hypothetical protein